MNRISINTSTYISSKTTTLIESEQKTSLKNQNKNIIKSFNSFQKKLKKISNTSFKYKSSEKKISRKEETKDDTDSESNIESTNNKNNTFTIKRHKKISRVPYDIKNNEILKLKFMNANMKSQKLPKFSSDSIVAKLKKDIEFPNVKILSKKKKSYLNYRRFSYISSDKKLFQQKCIFLNDENKYVTFGLYFDKDIIEKSKELNDELIENSYDIDNESDEENIINGIHVCYHDLKCAFSKIKDNPECISYVKDKKVKFFCNY